MAPVWRWTGTEIAHRLLAHTKIVGVFQLLNKGEARVGKPPPDAIAGAATRIATGAPIPKGAGLVVRREDAEDNDTSITILETASPRPGDNIRRAGENIRQGQIALQPGTFISPTVAAALATFGHTRVAVHRRVRVGIIVTGDEVIDPAQTPTPFQLRDSHAIALRAMFGPVACIDLAAAARVPDDPDTLLRAFRSIIPRTDALILTAGVSVGPHDLVPAALRKINATTLFRGVPQRPGRPTLGAVTHDDKPVMGLPGNPLSVFVAARRIAACVLAPLAGISGGGGAGGIGLGGGDGWGVGGGGGLVVITNPDDRTIPLHWHRPVQRLPGSSTQAALIETKGSHDVPAAARSTGFIHVPPDTRAEGSFPYYPWTLA